jgi:hypothetical protein
MKLCGKNACRHYSEASKYARLCYYEPQCWKGYVDLWSYSTVTLLARFRGKSIGHRRDLAAK